MVDIVTSDLVNLTGCLVPCTFNQYKMVNKPKKYGALHFQLDLRFARNEVLEEEEAYVYGFVSFVSEFGGSLGLFLGFSFMMVWEVFEPLLIIFHPKPKSSYKTRKV